MKSNRSADTLSKAWLNLRRFTREELSAQHTWCFRSRLYPLQITSAAVEFRLVPQAHLNTLSQLAPRFSNKVYDGKSGLWITVAASLTIFGLLHMDSTVVLTFTLHAASGYADSGCPSLRYRHLVHWRTCILGMDSNTAWTLDLPRGVWLCGDGHGPCCI